MESHAGRDLNLKEGVGPLAVEATFPLAHIEVIHVLIPLQDKILGFGLDGDR